MSNLQLALLVLGIAVIAVVYGYNVYQEVQFRKKIRAQFGGSQEDALLKTAQNQVRDADEPELLKPAFIHQHIAEETTTLLQTDSADTIADNPNQDLTEDKDEPVEPVLLQEETPAQSYIFEEVEVAPKAAEQAKRKLMLNLEEIPNIELSWFDKRFDYLAYLSLPFAQELDNFPRFSNRRRYQLIGCTQDGRYQIAEAIPGVLYQGFVAGIQAIDRNGLTSAAELQQFIEQVSLFAEPLQAGIHFTDVKAFLEQARELDQLCEEVDKVIAIHLVSQSSIPGVELRSSVEEMGFELEPDGSFCYGEEDAQPLFSIVTLDNTPFTSPLLSKQAYRGFSMLFDIALVPDGEKTFNQFMNIAVKLSNKLHLDLVDDQRQELSTIKLKEIRNFVMMQQAKLDEHHIKSGGKLAARLFS